MSDISQKLIVVEVYDACGRHHVVVCRNQGDAPHWHILFVRKPLSINFGDTLLMESWDKIWLDRGPTLRFRLILDDFPGYPLGEILGRHATAFGGSPLDYIMGDDDA